MDGEEKMVGQDVDVQPVGESDEAVASTTGTAPEAPEKAAAGEKGKGEARLSALEELKPGMEIRGRVRSIVEFGAFVDIGVGRDGLAHISTLKRAGIDQTLKVGDEITVRVRRIDPEDNRISLIVSREEKPKVALHDLTPGSVVTGRVVRLANFGAFVDIGAQTDGLVHISQLSNGRVNHPSEAVKVGDEVQVRILEVDARKRRISLSLKDAEQEVEEAEPAAPEAAADERIPTAFEVAFEKARAAQRRRRRAQR